MKYGILFFLLISADVPLLAQSVSAELYSAKIVTTEGQRIWGILYDVSDTHVQLTYEEERFRYDNPMIPLAAIKRVTVRRQSPRQATIIGAIAGGLGTSFIVVKSAQKNGFRSPVVYGLNLAFALCGGAGLGALIGNKIGNTSHRIIRPLNQDSEENLRRQLKPFTYLYQNGLLNRSSQ